MPVALVQQSAALDSATEPGTRQLTGVTAGNRLSALIITRDGTDIVSAIDDVNGSYATVFKTGATSGRRAALYEFLNCGAGNPILTVELTAADANLGIVLTEWSGSETVNTNNVVGIEQQNFAATSHPFSSIVCPGAGAIVCIMAFNSNLTETPTSGYLEINNGSRWFGQYKITSGETTTSTITTGSSGDSTGVQYFMAAASAGSSIAAISAGYALRGMR